MNPYRQRKEISSRGRREGNSRSVHDEQEVVTQAGRSDDTKCVYEVL